MTAQIWKEAVEGQQKLKNEDKIEITNQCLLVLAYREDHIYYQARKKQKCQYMDVPSGHLTG